MPQDSKVRKQRAVGRSDGREKLVAVPTRSRRVAATAPVAVPNAPIKWPPGFQLIGELGEVSPPEPISSQLGFYRGSRPWVLSGQAGEGKTYAAMAIALAYATGAKHALGGALKLDASGPVLWCAYEGFFDGLSRLRTIASALGHDLDALENFAILTQPDGGPTTINDTAGLQRFRADLPQHALVVVDSLSAATLGIDENHVEKANPLRWAERVAMFKEAAFLFVAHESKPASKPRGTSASKPRGTSASKPRGTSAINDAASVVSSLANKDGVRTLTCTKTNRRPHDPIRFRMHFVGDDFERFEAVSDKPSKAPITKAEDLRTKPSKVLNALRKHGQPASQSKLAELAKMSGKATKGELERLRTQDLVTFDGKLWSVA